MKFLIVDDNPLNAQSLCVRLEREAQGELETVVVTTLSEAMTALVDGDFDNVLCDLLLPDTDSKQLDKAPATIRAEYPDMEIAIISGELGDDPVLRRRLEKELRCLVVSKSELANSKVLARMVFGSKKARTERALLKAQRDPMAEANAANRRLAGATACVALLGVLAANVFVKEFDIKIVMCLMVAVVFMIGLQTGDVLKIISKLGEK